VTNTAAQHIHHILEPGEPQCIASGYTFTEGPLWDPAGRFYFADVCDDKVYRVVPGSAPELVRETRNGNRTCFDLQGRIVQCEGLTAGRPSPRNHRTSAAGGELLLRRR
jgi:sugar lactone lactonase YvrE